MIRSLRQKMLLAVAGAVALPCLAAAQQTQPPADTTPAPAVGTMAPDFDLPGADKFGLLKDPVRLSDFHGKTVVLAFFFRARTSG
jgi:hypothetical protein